MTMNPPHSRNRWLRHLLLYSLLAVSFATFFWYLIDYQTEQSNLAYEKRKAERRLEQFEAIKKGEQQAHIFDILLLPMLAEDSDCASNILEVHFDMVEITSDSSEAISSFENLKILGFYDCRGADYIMANARDLPIESLYFRMARLSEESLRSLSEFPNLKSVRFEHVMKPHEIAIAQSLRPGIEVEIPWPAEDEPKP
ncbi:MAG: hypothetical protein RH917_07615 [Lacipirellulaceae bacterium]